MIVRVRLTYRLVGTTTSTDREQYLTIVPRGDDWLVASDTDGSASGLDTQRDLWDLGPVRTLRGDTSLVVADRRGATVAEMQKLADEADLAVHDVDEVWTGEWSHQPLVLLPRSQADMATIIDSDGAGLAQIAAVTTGAFEAGLSRGDRIVINPASWKTLDALGRRVVLTHEMTHVATRSSSVQSVPIWLSEGFADYVAYRATPVPTAIVASDIFRKVRAGKAPDHLPDSADFDAARGDIASSYESAWLACRMISEQYGEKKLVKLYSALSDSAGPGWPDETVDVLGVGRRALVHDWKAYLKDKASSSNVGHRGHSRLTLTLLSAGGSTQTIRVAPPCPWILWTSSTSSQTTVDRVPVSHRTTAPPSENAAPSATRPVPEMPVTSWSRCSWKRRIRFPPRRVAAGPRGGTLVRRRPRWASWWRYDSRQLAI